MNDELNSYSLLSRLPLFQGMSGAELDYVISRVRLGFSKVDAGEMIVAEGSLADRLVFVVRGELDSEMFADDRDIPSWRVSPCHACCSRNGCSV